jgi:hypothetical protein
MLMFCGDRPVAELRPGVRHKKSHTFQAEALKAACIPSEGVGSKALLDSWVCPMTDTESSVPSPLFFWGRMCSQESMLLGAKRCGSEEGRLEW